MSRMVFIILMLFTASYAQLPNTFTETAATYEGGLAMDVLSSSYAVYLANGTGGVQIYGWDGSEFTHTVNIDDGGTATGLAKGTGSMLFVANGDDGLRAYEYDFDDSSWVNTAHVNDGGTATKVYYNAANSTVFLANGTDGLRAYAYSGSTFTNTAHTTFGSGTCRDVIVHSSGAVMVAHSIAGVVAYTYTDSSFILVDSERDYSTSNPQALVEGNYGYVYLANGYAGLYAYEFSSSNFNQLGKIDDVSGFFYDVWFKSDGTIFTANNASGVRAYTFGVVFENKTGIVDKGLTRGISVSGNTVFAAANWGGLRAYSYSSSTERFTRLAHVNDGGDASDVVVTADSSVFLANGEFGLEVYIHDSSAFTWVTDYDINEYTGTEAVAVRSDSMLFLANGSKGLYAYRYDSSLALTARAYVNSGGTAMDVAVGPAGNIFVANGTDGLRAYTYDGSLRNRAHIFNGGTAQRVAVGPDGTVFLANGTDGLRAYDYTGQVFTNTAHIDDGGTAAGVAVGPDGTVYLANNGDGLRAYAYDGTSFTGIAHVDSGGEALDIAIGADGTVFLANGTDGMRAFVLDDSIFENTAHVTTGEPVAAVTVSPDGSVYLAYAGDGLVAYTYDGYAPADTTGPAISLQAPAAGDTLVQHTPVTVSWDASDDQLLNRVEIQLSQDNGASWQVLDTAWYAGGYNWTVRHSAGDSCRIKVTAYDLAGNSASDSSGMFAIVTLPLQLTLPADGDTLTADGSLVWEYALDSLWGGTLGYRVFFFTDSLMADTVVVQDSAVAGTLLVADITDKDSLPDNQVIYWQVTAYDPTGVMTGASPGAAWFFLNMANDAPGITSAALDTATEEITYRYIATATDPDGVPVISFEDVPGWCLVSGDTLYGTPAEGTMDTSFTVIASDGELADTLTVALAVLAVNDAPVITSAAADTATQGQAYAYTAAATDPDDVPVISFAEYPAWLTVAGSSISGTPSYTAGDTSFVVIASDGELADTVTVQLHVVQVSGIGDIDRMPAQGISVPAGSYNLYGGPATRNGIGIILVRDTDGTLVKRLRLE